MKYDFTVQIRDEFDVLVKTSPTDSKPWTILAALKGAVLADRPENQGNKVQRYELWLKLRDHGPDTEYSTEEVTLLKSCALTLPAFYAGMVSHLLDQKTVT